MKIKNKMLIDKISGFFVEMVLPFCLVLGFFLLLGYAVHHRQKTINGGIAGGRLVKVDDYVFEKLTIDGHEYLKFNNGIAHSGSCPCFSEDSSKGKVINERHIAKREFR